MIGYDPRPLIRIIPPPNAKSNRVRTYTYLEAIQKYPTNFSSSDLEFILSKVGYKQKGQLRALFVCLSDDMLRSFKKSRPDRQAEDDANHEAEADDRAEAIDPKQGSSSSEAMDVSTREEQASDRETQVPSRNSSRSGHSSRSSSGSGGRSSSHKRGAPSPALGSVPEKSARV